MLNLFFIIGKVLEEARSQGINSLSYSLSRLKPTILICLFYFREYSFIFN